MRWGGVAAEHGAEFGLLAGGGQLEEAPAYPRLEVELRALEAAVARRPPAVEFGGEHLEGAFDRATDPNRSFQWGVHARSSRPVSATRTKRDSASSQKASSQRRAASKPGPVQAEHVSSAPRFTRHQRGVLEDPEVPRYRRLADGQLGRDLADRPRPGRQDANDVPAGGTAERVERRLLIADPVWHFDGSITLVTQTLP